MAIPVGDEPGTGHVHLVGASRQDIEVPAQNTSVDAGRRVLEVLRVALALFRGGVADSTMSRPLNKTSLRLVGMREEDELRWFAKELDFEGFISELDFAPGLATS